ncbi:hypothetical protein JZ751_008066 [Albula glossodonta]|uniref:Uncharacterized protein n=1 Tax=Albula glossodonta TaxID=121402 RepID=A0A8T2P4N9_9TELE|nr:hypothetical protein JZ751_008066 [Albula glossodonta]
MSHKKMQDPGWIDDLLTITSARMLALKLRPSNGVSIRGRAGPAGRGRWAKGGWVRGELAERPPPGRHFPMISEFGEDRNSYCSFEPKETALLQSENGSLQQRVNTLTHETTLVEKHMERIRNLEGALRQRDSSLQKLNTQLHSKDMQYLQLHASPEVSHSDWLTSIAWVFFYVQS